MKILLLYPKYIVSYSNIDIIGRLYEISREGVCKEATPADTRVGYSHAPGGFILPLEQLPGVLSAIAGAVEASLGTMTTVAQTATAETTGGTAGVSSQWTFGTALLWGGVVVLVLYVLYRRFGYRPP